MWEEKKKLRCHIYDLRDPTLINGNFATKYICSMKNLMRQTDILYHMLEVFWVKLGNFVYTLQDNVLFDAFLEFLFQ